MDSPDMSWIRGEEAGRYRKALEDAHEYCCSLVSEVLSFDNDGMPPSMFFLRGHLVNELRKARGEFERLLCSEEYGTGSGINRVRVEYARLCMGNSCCYKFADRTVYPEQREDGPKSI